MNVVSSIYRYLSKHGRILNILLKLINRLPYVRDKLKKYAFMAILNELNKKRDRYTIKNFKGELDIEEEIVYKKLQHFKRWNCS